MILAHEPQSGRRFFILGGEASRPAIILAHGLGQEVDGTGGTIAGVAKDFIAMSGLVPWATKHHFTLVYLEGQPRRFGLRSWNKAMASGREWPAAEDNNDVAYGVNVVKMLAQQFVVIAGFSAGVGLAHRLLNCLRARAIGAIFHSGGKVPAIVRPVLSMPVAVLCENEGHKAVRLHKRFAKATALAYRQAGANVEFTFTGGKHAWSADHNEAILAHLGMIS